MSPPKGLHEIRQGDLKFPVFLLTMAEYSQENWGQQEGNKRSCCCAKDLDNGLSRARRRMRLHLDRTDGTEPLAR